MSRAPAAVPEAVLPRLDAGALVRVTGLFLMSRLLVLCVAALSHTAVVQGFFATRTRTWVERFAAWDTTWYLGIVSGGYSYDPQGQSSVAFYPLYPMLIRAGTFCGFDARLTGYAISLAALYASCLLLWRLAARETRSAAVAERAVLFLLVCPGTMWFGLIYTESLYLLTLLGCLLCARQGRWLAAGFWGLAAALTRTPGLLLAGFLVLEAAQQWLERRRAGGRRDAPTPAAPAEADGARLRTAWWQASRWPWLTRAALAAAAPVAGNASFLLFLQLRFGDWRAQQKTMNAGWHGEFRAPWDALALQWRTLDPVFVDVSMPLLAIVLGLSLIGLATLKRVGYAVLVFALAFLYVVATPGDSVTRYLCTTATPFIVLAQLAEGSRLLETTVLVFSVAVMTVLTVLRANGYRIL